MEISGLAILLVLAAIAAYVQTLTGFALGLIMMGGVGLTGVISLPEAAILVSCLTFANATLVLAKGWRDVARREFASVMVSGVITILAGYWLLTVLASTSIGWLKLTLGVVIIVSSVQLALKPLQLAQPSSPLSFLCYGGVAGLMGGLFSTSGPPLVYHFYRQPMNPVAIRETLVAIFAANASMRLGIVAFAGDLPPASFWWGLLSLPMVITFTLAAKKWPPPISYLVMRRFAFVLLLLSGVSLAVTAAFDLSAAR